MIDLHCHSTYSDGSLTPEQLIAEAEQIGLTALALTDHDTTAGLPRFLAAAAGKSVRAVPGVELSVDCSSGVMHMLGYWMDLENPELVRQMAWIRDGREMRNRSMLEKLNALGFGTGLVFGDKNEAFDKWLGDGKPGYADRPRLTAEIAVALIRQAGGVAVLAHPFSLRIGKDAMASLFIELAAAGLAGVECYYSEHSADLTKEYLAMAQQANLVPTGGSDFHGEVSPGIRLGSGFGGLNVPDEVLAQLEARRG